MSDPKHPRIHVAGAGDLPNSTKLPDQSGTEFEPFSTAFYDHDSPDTLQQTYNHSVKGDIQPAMLSTTHMGLQGPLNGPYTDSDDGATEDSHDRNSKEPSPDDATIRSESDVIFHKSNGNGLSPTFDFSQRSTMSPPDSQPPSQSPFNGSSMSPPPALQFPDPASFTFDDLVHFNEDFHVSDSTVDPNNLTNFGLFQAPTQSSAPVQAHNRQQSQGSSSHKKSRKPKKVSANHSPVFQAGSGVPGPTTSGAPAKPHPQSTQFETFGAPSTSNGLTNGFMGPFGNSNLHSLEYNPFGGIHPNMTLQQQFGVPPVAQPLPRTVKQPPMLVQVGQDKSRVETQIKFQLTLNSDFNNFTKVHLPSKKISKPKLLAKPPPLPNSNTLELSVALVCTSAMQKPELKENAMERARNSSQDQLPASNEEKSPQDGYDVRICDGCISRERKRTARKKVKNKQEEDAWAKDEEHRVVVFNCPELRDLGPTDASEGHVGKKIELPMRIACYCRHHSEKMGFQVIFTLKDMYGRVLAQEMSKPIMITDDHKNTIAQPLAVADVVDGAIVLDHGDQNGQHQHLNGLSHPNGSEVAMGSTGGTPPPRSRPSSRPSSPSRGGPNKKRKSSASAARVPNNLAMTRLDGASPTQQQQQDMSFSNAFATLNGSQAMDSNAVFAANGNVSNNVNGMANGIDHGVGNGGVNGMPSGMNHGNMNGNALNQPSTPGINEQHRLIGNHIYSEPSSRRQSRAASPNAMMNGGMHTPPQNNIQRSIAQNYHMMPSAAGMELDDHPPIISQIIPDHGSTSGGTQVSVLGKNLPEGLVIEFGAYDAMNTVFHSETAVICRAPPSPGSGWVPVRIRGHPSPTGQSSWFRYDDDLDQNLMASTIALLSGKFNGNGQNMGMNDHAQNVLNAFMNRNGLGNGGGGAGGSSNGGMNGHAGGPTDSLETQIIRCLEIIDEDDSQYEVDLDLQDSRGQTILHLASMQGYRRLVAALLARGANPNEKDYVECTPLHLAAIAGRAEVAKTLVQAGANALVSNNAGMLPIQLSKNAAVKEAIKFSEPRRPSHGGGDLAHSRASSVSSLRSLRELSRMSSRHSRPASVHDDEESLEYTTGDLEDEDPDEDVYIHMRRPSGLRQDLPRQATEEMTPDVTQASAMTAALKEHFQQQLNQIQQSMALHLQNLPQMPHLPQMPTLPGVPFGDYQAYLQQAPFMRRMTQYMPGMAGGSPDSQDGPDNKMDHRWWDLSSLMGNSSVPPPAYEELYPQKDMDTKQSSAAQAAADAEADMKCANLYDQAQESTQETETTVEEVKTQVPSVLKIGHKNAITREQQEQFLRAREQKLKKLGNDRKLFFVWIPLLICMIFTMLYSYFPTFFILVWNMLRSFARVSAKTVTQVWNGPRSTERVVEL